MKSSCYGQLLTAPSAQRVTQQRNRFGIQLVGLRRKRLTQPTVVVYADSYTRPASQKSAGAELQTVLGCWTSDLPLKNEAMTSCRACARFALMALPDLPAVMKKGYEPVPHWNFPRTAAFATMPDTRHMVQTALTACRAWTNGFHQPAAKIMAKRDISAPGALPHNRLEWSSAKRQRADDNTKRKEQIMNEANNLPEDQELSWILEEYRDWAEKNQYEFMVVS